MRRQVPGTSLGTLLLATYGLDLIWPVLLLAGAERVRIEPGNTAFTPLAFDWYPWSHSLLLALTWGILAAVLHYAGRRLLPAAVMVGSLVASHWVLDWLTHRPDLPLWPGAGAPRAGLGLWNSIPATLLIEGLMFAAGIGLYLRGTRPRDRIGSVGLVTLVAFLVLAWVSGPFSPPPPSATAVAWVGVLTGPVLGWWAWWVDRHRTVAAPGDG